MKDIIVTGGVIVAMLGLLMLFIISGSLLVQGLCIYGILAISYQNAHGDIDTHQNKDK